MYQKTNLTKILIVAFSVALGLMVWYTLTTPLYQGFSVLKTPYRTVEHASLAGKNIYSYNGAAFIKTPLLNRDNPTILSTAFHLPNIETLNWAGDTGALLTFTDGGYIGSDVERELKVRDQSWNDQTRRYVWFADFSDSKLYLVSQYGLASQSVHYSPTQKQLYYFRYGGTVAESDQPVSQPFASYSTDNHQETEITRDVSNPEDITHLTSCYGHEIPCYIVRYGETEKLIATDKTGKTTELKIGENTYGTILPTSEPEIFFGYTHQTFDSGYLEAEVPSGTVDRIDLATNIVQTLPGRVQGGETLSANTSSEDHFFIIDSNARQNRSGLSVLTGGKNLLGQYRVKPTDFNGLKKGSEALSILPPVSYGSDGLFLFNNTDDSFYLISQKGDDTFLEDRVVSARQAGAQLDNCFKNYTSRHDFTDSIMQFKVSVNYDENYQATIKKFTECAAKSAPLAMVGYSFVFVGVQPDTGRYVTD